MSDSAVSKAASTAKTSCASLTLKEKEHLTRIKIALAFDILHSKLSIRSGNHRRNNIEVLTKALSSTLVPYVALRPHKLVKKSITRVELSPIKSATDNKTTALSYFLTNISLTVFFSAVLKLH